MAGIAFHNAQFYTVLFSLKVWIPNIKCTNLKPTIQSQMWNTPKKTPSQNQKKLFIIDLHCLFCYKFYKCTNSRLVFKNFAKCHTNLYIITRVFQSFTHLCTTSQDRCKVLHNFTKSCKMLHILTNHKSVAKCNTAGGTSQNFSSLSLFTCTGWSLARTSQTSFHNVTKYFKVLHYYFHNITRMLH